MKQCPRCKKTYMKAEKHFHKSKRNKDGLSSVCKQCKKDEHIYYHTFKKIEESKTCLYCKKDFVTTRSFQKYCNPKCGEKDRIENKYGKEMFYARKLFKKRFDNKKQRENAKNVRKTWTNKEVEMLKKLHFDGFSFREIGEKIGRTQVGCYKKWKGIMLMEEIKN